MRLFVVAVAVGAIVGSCRGGRFSRLGQVPLRANWLVWLALAVQVSGGIPAVRSLPHVGRFGLVLASYALIGAWLVHNAGRSVGFLRHAWALMALGWILNLAVMAANSGMPVSADAMDRSNLADVAVAEGHLWKHVPLRSSTRLAPLGDVIPAPPLRSVLSIGDIGLGAGLAALIAVGMLRRPCPTDGTGTIEAAGAYSSSR